VTAWLSYWKADTRRENEGDLTGEIVEEIYVPWGEGLIERGDTIYCIFIEDGELHLVTRLTAATVEGDPDPEHEQSVSVTPEPTDEIRADYQRVVVPGDLKAIKYERPDGSEASLEDPNAGRFQGRNSIRKLTDGTHALEATLKGDGTP